MELGSEDISPRNRASKRRWIGGRRRGQRGVLRHRVITVGEIEPGFLLDALPKRVRARLVHGAPAHVGHLQPLAALVDHPGIAKALDTSRQDAKAREWALPH